MREDKMRVCVRDAGEYTEKWRSVFFLGDEAPSPPCTALPSYGHGGGSVACCRTIHAATASDGDILNA
jgi:hypothetical protein